MLLRSWVESANSESTHFPLNNLPYGVFSKSSGPRRCGVAIGEFVLDITTLEEHGFTPPSSQQLFNQGNWNSFMEAGSSYWDEFRNTLQLLLAIDGESKLREDKELVKKILIPIKECSLHLPIQVAEYTDFYAGKNHAFNVGSMFRGPENALPPNWLHIPIGYNGRASTVIVSGTDVVRPCGQVKPRDANEPYFGPTKRLDFELELGAIVGSSSELGQPISVAQADKMIFGYVILNDWSARDIQAWEYQPLGPFQAKAFATSISPWIIPKQALEPFRCSTPEREKKLLPYLVEPSPMLYNIELEVSLIPNNVNESIIVTKTNYNEMYYSSAQQLCHHASSGCAMNVGDLLGSGTISGSVQGSRGSLLEITWGGKEPITLKNGETRKFLEDNDIVSMTGFAKGDGFQIGFGDCDGKILPAIPIKDTKH